MNGKIHRNRNSAAPELMKLSLESVRNALLVLGLIESQGPIPGQGSGDGQGLTPGYDERAYKEKSGGPSIRATGIADIQSAMDGLILYRSGETRDWRRQIQNARRIFRILFPEFSLEGDRSGYRIASRTGRDNARTCAVQPELRQNASYSDLLILLLAILQLEGDVELDFLEQLLHPPAPMALIVNLTFAIRNSSVCRFLYTNRDKVKASVEDFVPSKVLFRRGRWMVTGYRLSGMKAILFMLHSMENLHVDSKSAMEGP